MLNDDLDAILADPVVGSVRVCVAGEETRGHFDDTDTVTTGGLEAGESLEVYERMVRVRTGTLTGLARHVAVTLIDADGVATAYVARDVRRVNDGRETLIVLAEG